jgi:hypothetical protein
MYRDQADSLLKYYSKTCFQDADILTIVQLTDIHYQATYLPGGNAECNEPMCCRSDQGLPSTPEAEAGYWGAFTCDTPWNVFDDTMTQIKKAHPVKKKKTCV